MICDSNFIINYSFDLAFGMLVVLTFKLDASLLCNTNNVILLFETSFFDFSIKIKILRIVFANPVLYLHFISFFVRILSECCFVKRRDEMIFLTIWQLIEFRRSTFKHHPLSSKWEILSGPSWYCCSCLIDWLMSSSFSSYFRVLISFFLAGSLQLMTNFSNFEKL